MTKKHFNNIKDAKLSDLITPDVTRLILNSMRNIPLGYSELPIEIYLSSKSCKILKFATPWDGELYGCIRGKKELLNKIGMTDENSNVSISLSDWDDKFALIFENKNPVETKAFSVTPEEVYYLLNNCMRVPQLR